MSNFTMLLHSLQMRAERLMLNSELVFEHFGSAEPVPLNYSVQS